MNDIINGDCLEVMKKLKDGCIDMILCDLPYGTTACKWDMVIPFEPLWEQYKRVIKDNSAIVLTASQPFTSNLIMSNIEMFKYNWVWQKSKSTGHVHAKNKPMKSHEDVCVFSNGTTVHASQSKNRMIYNPQGLIKKDIPTIRKCGGTSDVVMGNRPSHKDILQEYTNYPKSLLSIPSEGKNIHPTQKPVALFEYLIKTYTNEGDIVLDNCSGSGTTAVACLNTNRKYVCIEQDEEYFKKSVERVEDWDKEHIAKSVI